MTDVAQGGASAGGWSPERSAAGGHNPYLIAFVVSIATFMEVLDSTIANVALRHHRRAYDPHSGSAASDRFECVGAGH